MKISYNWLKNYLQIDKQPDELAEILTSMGLEVEGMEAHARIPGGLAGVFTGEVLSCQPHPNADKLRLTTVSVGGEEALAIVCGAPNVAAGQKVLVATLGTELSFSNGEKITIKKAKIRGEESCGMICAEDELGLGASHEGIMVLPPETPVGVSAKEYLGLEEDTVFEIGLTPNRVDAASHIGVARDLRAWACANGMDVCLQRPSVEAFVPGKGQGAKVVVEASEGAPRYTGLSMKNVKVGTSPQWLQDRLQAIGLRPINNVVDISNFVLHETGQPLHIFDRAKIKGDRVVVRYAKEAEKFTTLDGVARMLTAQDLMICNNEDPMCLAGIFGGQDSGVSEKTTSVFIESAYFQPVTIRKSSKRHGLKTDASFRYERGADPEICLYALKRAALLLQEIAGAEVVDAPIDLYPKPVVPVNIRLCWPSLFALMGTDIPLDTAKAMLKGLDCEIIADEPEATTVRVPAYRVDVTRPCDMAEELLRIWGYNRVVIPQRVSASVAPNPKPDPEAVRARTADMLVANGFHEIMCNSLCSAAWYEGLSTFPSANLVRLLNPLSSDLNVMRQSLLPGGLEVIAYNMNRQQYDLKLFEYGNVYSFDEQKATEGLKAYTERPRVALWITGLSQHPHWRHPARPSHFFFLKGYLEKLFTQYGLPMFDLEYTQAPEDLFSEGLSYLYKGKLLAYMGVVNNKCLKTFDIKQDVYAAEVCWDVLFKAIKGLKVRYAALPRYPEVRRDLALVVDEAQSYALLRQIAFRTEKRLLKKVSLFDVYKGDKLPEGKKQYALSFVLQDTEKTLTDNMVDSVMERLLAAFGKDAGAVLR